MWRTTIVAAGLAVALGGAAADLSAQWQARGKATSTTRGERPEVLRGGERGSSSSRPEVLRGGDRQGERGRVYGRGVDRRDRDSDRYDRRRRDRDSDRYDDRWERNRRNAPPFCRNGSGHPVHGREWCRDKGYGLGNDRWDRVRWEDVVFGRRYPTSGRVSGSLLDDILGRAVYGRLIDQQRRLGGGSMHGQWLTPSGGPRILNVYSGSLPLAEFVDVNRDGRVDYVLLNRGRR